MKTISKILVKRSLMISVIIIFLAISINLLGQQSSQSSPKTLGELAFNIASSIALIFVGWLSRRISDYQSSKTTERLIKLYENRIESLEKLLIESNEKNYKDDRATGRAYNKMAVNLESPLRFPEPSGVDE